MRLAIRLYPVDSYTTDDKLLTTPESPLIINHPLCITGLKAKANTKGGMSVVRAVWCHQNRAAKKSFLDCVFMATKTFVENQLLLPKLSSCIQNTYFYNY